MFTRSCVAVMIGAMKARGIVYATHAALIAAVMLADAALVKLGMELSKTSATLSAASGVCVCACV